MLPSKCFGRWVYILLSSPLNCLESLMQLVTSENIYIRMSEKMGYPHKMWGQSQYLLPIYIYILTLRKWKLLNQRQFCVNLWRELIAEQCKTFKERLVRLAFVWLFHSGRESVASVQRTGPQRHTIHARGSPSLSFSRGRHNGTSFDWVKVAVLPIV